MTKQLVAESETELALRRECERAAAAAVEADALFGEDDAKKKPAARKRARR